MPTHQRYQSTSKNFSQNTASNSVTRLHTNIIRTARWNAPTSHCTGRHAYYYTQDVCRTPTGPELTRAPCTSTASPPTQGTQAAFHPVLPCMATSPKSGTYVCSAVPSQLSITNGRPRTGHFGGTRPFILATTKARPQRVDSSMDHPA
jgi:hypothetical protein